MVRRRRKDAAALAIGTAFIGLLVLCCGGPVTFLASFSPKPQPAADKPLFQAATPTVQSRAASQPKSSPDAAGTPQASVSTPSLSQPVAVLLPETPAESARLQPSSRPNVFRSWTNDTGKHTVVAALARFDATSAVLQREDGKPISLPLEKLSEADRAYVSTLTAVPTFLENGKVIFGETVGVTDGDTITVLDDDKTNFKIRLEGIDAPESHQDYGTRSKKALSDQVFRKFVRVEWKEKDRYGRTLGHVYVGTKYVNLEMLEEGMAWHYKKYNADEELAAAEMRARDGRKGLWKEAKPIAPWDFRKGVADEPAAVVDLPMPVRVPVRPSFVPSPARSEAATATVYVTRTGSKYHRGGCRHLAKSKIPMDLSSAKARYSPCSVCNPP